MRIHDIRIRRFRNLHNFATSFADEAIVALLGRNASAKSNFIEALISIFRELELREPPSFQYRITFCCKSKDVIVDAGFTDETASTITVGEITFSYSEYIRAFTPSENEKRRSKRLEEIRLNVGDFLPNHVFTYYSGLNRRTADLFHSTEEDYRTRLRKNERSPLRRLFFTDGGHCPEILLTFLCDPSEWSRDFLREYINLDSVEHVRLHLTQPDWFSHSKAPAASAMESGSRYWFTGGQTYTALRTLQDTGIPLCQMNSDPDASPESVHVFFDKERLAALRAADVPAERVGSFSRAKDLFQGLDDLRLSGFLKRIHFGLRIRGSDDLVDIDKLSEGEKQLLIVVGLIRFTRDQDALFLLDEPDTHLNPQWSYVYKRHLEDAMEVDRTCQILIATHDPIMVAGMTKDQVKIFARSGTESPIIVSEPDEDPLGMGIGKILTSAMFGLRSLLDEQTLADLDRKRDLAVKEPRTSAETEELRTLNRKLREIDMTCLIEDPLYALFVNSVVKHADYAHLKTLFLSGEGFDELKSIAEQVRKDLLDSLDQPAV